MELSEAQAKLSPMASQQFGMILEAVHGRLRPVPMKTFCSMQRRRKHRVFSRAHPQGFGVVVALAGFLGPRTVGCRGRAAAASLFAAKDIQIPSSFSPFHRVS